MLKHIACLISEGRTPQPPSGGCVLKQPGALVFLDAGKAAAFGRLCVETSLPKLVVFVFMQPPSGGCVLKHQQSKGQFCQNGQPPSGGCVLKHVLNLLIC